MENERLKNIVKNVINYWKEISLVLAFIGVISLMSTLTNLSEENTNMSEAVSKWYRQLPEEHWIKVDENNYFDDNFFTYQIMEIYQMCIGTSSTLFQLSNITMQEDESYLIQFFGKTMETCNDRNKDKYNLRYADTGKKVGAITVNIDESKDVLFYYDGIKLLLDFTEEEYCNEIQVEFKNGVPNIANKIVYSYMEDNYIAKIYDGKITGLKEGKTILHLYCNGYHFTYNVKVKDKGCLERLMCHDE